MPFIGPDAEGALSLPPGVQQIKLVPGADVGYKDKNGYWSSATVVAVRGEVDIIPTEGRKVESRPIDELSLIYTPDPVETAYMRIRETVMRIDKRLEGVADLIAGHPPSQAGKAVLGFFLGSLTTACAFLFYLVARHG